MRRNPDVRYQQLKRQLSQEPESLELLQAVYYEALRAGDRELAGDLLNRVSDLATVPGFPPLISERDAQLMPEEEFREWGEWRDMEWESALRRRELADEAWLEMAQAFWGENPPTGGFDERMRRLERAAAGGDLEAQGALDQERRRAGLPVLADQLRAVEESVAFHQHAEPGRRPHHPLLFPKPMRWRDLFVNEMPTRDEVEVELPPELHGASYRTVRDWLTPARQERIGLTPGGELGVGEDHFSWTVRLEPPGSWQKRFHSTETVYPRRGRGRAREVSFSIPIGPYCGVSGGRAGHNSLYVLAVPEVYDAIRGNMIAAGVNDSILFDVLIREGGTALVRATNSVIIGGRWLAVIPAMDVPFQDPPTMLRVST